MLKSNNISNKKPLFDSIWLVIILFAFSSGLAFYLLRNTVALVDEQDHYAQIIRFIHGNYSMLEITTLPGYHVLMSLLAGITGLDTLGQVRLLSFLTGSVSVWVFYRLVRIDREGYIPRTLQFFFMPPVFIFLFLVYTDILSLLFVLLMAGFTLDKKFVWAGLFGLLSVLVRQNNVMWVFFMMVLSLPVNGRMLTTRSIPEWIGKMWPYIITLVLFVVYFIVNKGAAAGDVAHHPAFKLSAGNIFFSLLCCFIFFLPMHIHNLPRVATMIRNHKWTAWILIPCLAIYFWTFRNDHPYNHLVPEYFIRNGLLIYISSSAIIKGLFFLPIAYAALSLASTPMKRRRYALLYVFWPLFLAPSWMIEWRYYLIPFVLLLLFRKPLPKQTEWASVVYYMLILAVVFRLIARRTIFL